jgi:hypothetical protein
MASPGTNLLLGGEVLHLLHRLVVLLLRLLAASTGLDLGGFYRRPVGEEGFENGSGLESENKPSQRIVRGTTRYTESERTAFEIPTLLFLSD